MSEISTVEIKNMLDDLENDNDFIELRKLYETPNCFTIMGDKRREEWHSNFVCWLLDPNENHGLGKFPLVKFLDLVESKCEELNIDKTDVENMEFKKESSAKDQTDNKGRMDILGTSTSLTLVIENKIKASENSKNDKPQSDVYFDSCENEEKYKNSQRVYVLLKASSDTSLENKNFIHVTYQDLLDEVIKPAYEKCEELKLEDTKSVLKQYALDISNPFSDPQLAYANKDLSENIFKKHEEIISKIRQTMSDKKDRDKESVIYVFFNKYKEYINNAILKPLGKNAINDSRLDTKDTISYLMRKKYIIPGKTKLYYNRLKKTFIIKIDEKDKFWAGYYEGKYDDSREVNYIIKEYNSLHPAAADIEEIAAEIDQIIAAGIEEIAAAEIEQIAAEIERKARPNNSNRGIGPRYMKLLNSGVKDAEGMTIGDILDSINNSNI